MKTHNLRKVIIPSFALLIGASLVATISSTLAWFQYATRAQLAYIGALSHCSKLLKISIDNGQHWGNDYYQDDMANHITGNHLVPITTGIQAKDDALSNFYLQPDFGRGDYSKWTPASSEYYAQFTILVKVNDVDGADTPLVNDVYINDLLIQDDSTNGTTNDLSDAVRVHLAVTDASETPLTKHFLFAKGNILAPTDDVITSVGSCLDLNNDGAYDKAFDNFGTYSVGDVVVDDLGDLYQCKKTVSTPMKNIDTAGEEAHWKSITPSEFSDQEFYELHTVVLHDGLMYKCNQTEGVGPCEWVSGYWTLVNPIQFYCMYGSKDGEQVAFSNKNPNLIVEDPDNPIQNTTPVSIGKTGSNNMRIVVTTWIEGWAKLDYGLPGNAHGTSTSDTDTPIWDPIQYVNKRFNVGIRLGVKSHSTDHQN